MQPQAFRFHAKQNGGPGVSPDPPLRVSAKHLNDIVFALPSQPTKPRLARYPARDSDPYGLAATCFADTRVYQFRQPGRVAPTGATIRALRRAHDESRPGYQLAGGKPSPFQRDQNHSATGAATEVDVLCAILSPPRHHVTLFCISTYTNQHVGPGLARVGTQVVCVGTWSSTSACWSVTSGDWRVSGRGWLAS